MTSCLIVAANTQRFLQSGPAPPVSTALSLLSIVIACLCMGVCLYYVASRSVSYTGFSYWSRTVYLYCLSYWSRTVYLYCLSDSLLYFCQNRSLIVDASNVDCSFKDSIAESVGRKGKVFFLRSCNIIMSCDCPVSSVGLVLIVFAIVLVLPLCCQWAGNCSVIVLQLSHPGCYTP
jgi:hypothetical protein